MNKMVSIILPVHNGETYLKKSIESCLNQTYNNIEIIIVNDASTDNSAKIIEEYARTYKNIKVLHNQVNKKLPASLNIGLSYATGEYLTWTSDDNMYDITAIEELVSAINGHDIVYTNYRKIDFDSKYLTDMKLPEIDNLYLTNCVGACFLFKKNVFTSLKGYNETLFLIEDYDFWIRAKMQGFSFVHLKKILYSYRVHDFSLSTYKRKEVIEVETNYFKNMLKLDSDLLLFHFRANMLIDEFSIKNAYELSLNWDKLIYKLKNELEINVDSIAQLLLKRVKFHIILILIAKKILINITIEANKDFCSFYSELLSNIAVIETSSHKNIYLYYKKQKFNIATEKGICLLLKAIYWGKE